MEAKDLMIGDWVKEHNDCRGIIMDAKDLISGDLVKEHCIGDFVFRVSSITKHIVGSILDGDICASSIDKVEPIPITEKFLLKNGFEKTRESTTVKCFRLVLSASDEGEEVLLIDMRLKENRLVFEYIDNGYGRCAINLQDPCVHQLQHILRLLNIGLNVEA